MHRYLKALLYFSCCAGMTALSGATYTVTSLADTASGTGTSGTLRYCINQANIAAGPNTIQFSVGGTINLTMSLPPIGANIASISSNGNAVVIDGSNLYQPFFVQAGAAVTIGNAIAVQNGASIGGTGGAGGSNGGGGALGAGGGVFVANGASTTIQGIAFTNCKAVGGGGGAGGAGTFFGGGGGGGMSGGTGGSGASASGGGGGGGYNSTGGASGGTGGGGGGGLFFGGGNGSDGGGGGGSDAQTGFSANSGNGGAGGTDSGTHAGGAGGAEGTTGGAGGPGTGLSGGGGGGFSTAATNGGIGGNSALGAGGGGGSATGVGANGGASTGSLGGGGGGGASTSGSGGSSGGVGGNFGGGGGGGGSSSATQGGVGGNGGFGGGGGGAGLNVVNLANFGNGGFGAGGGGGYTNASSGLGGFQAGNGGGASLTGGGGGAALGGTLFIGQNSSLTIQTPPQTTITSATSSGGTGGTPSGHAGSVLGPDIFLMSSGSLIFAQSTTFTVSTAIASDNGAGGGSTTAGGVVMNGSGILVLGGVNTYTGFTSLGLSASPGGGTIQISADNNLGAASNAVVFGMGNGTLNLTTAVSSARNVLLSGTGNIQTSTGTSTWSGVFSGTGILQVSGTGTLQLSNTNNTYSGGTLLTGLLQISAPGNIGTGVITFGSGTQTGVLELLSAFASSTLSNNILINAAGGTLQIDAASQNPVLSGNIVGTAGTLNITQPSSSTLTLTGSNSFSGITTLSAGTLQISSNNGFLLSNLVNNGALIFNQPGGAFVGGNISGTGSLIVQGPGLVDLFGTSTFSGLTTINGGALFVDGSSTASAITVNSGALLGGSGRVQNVTVQNGGAVAPGDGSAGTLSGNNFTFTPGSSLLVVLDNTGSGQIAASDTITIQPGALLTLLQSAPLDPLVTEYTIATASSITGSRFTLTSPLPRFILDILYSPTEIVMLVLAPPYNLLLPPGNAKNAAVCFDTIDILEPSDLIELTEILDLQIPSQLQHSFNKMQPANLDDIAYATQNVAERIRQIYTLHFFEQRAVACSPDKQAWRIWAAPFIEHVQQKGESLLKGYRENFLGVSTAFDYHKKHWMFSSGFSYATTNMNITHAKTHADFKSYAGTVGASWSDSSWFADVQFSYFYSPIHAKRKMNFSIDTAALTSTVKFKAHHHDRSNQLMGHLGGGYDVRVPAGEHGTTNFYPFGNVDYIYDMQAGYREKGAGSLNLKVHGKRYDLLRPEVGLGIGYHGCFKSADVWFDVSASYVLEFRFIGKETHARFKKTPCTFEVRGLNPENNVICPEVRLRVMSPINGFSVTLGYHGEFGKKFTENAGQAELRKAF